MRYTINGWRDVSVITPVYRGISCMLTQYRSAVRGRHREQWRRGLSTAGRALSPIRTRPLLAAGRDNCDIVRGLRPGETRSFPPRFGPGLSAQTRPKRETDEQKPSSVKPSVFVIFLSVFFFLFFILFYY